MLKKEVPMLLRVLALLGAAAVFLYLEYRGPGAGVHADDILGEDR